jgi:hypothetical protein
VHLPSSSEDRNLALQPEGAKSVIARKLEFNDSLFNLKFRPESL